MKRPMRRLRLALAAALLATGTPMLLAGPARAASEAVEDATFTWSVSEHAFTGHLSGGHKQSGDVEKVPEVGFRWTGGEGVVDPVTGEVDVAFDGVITLGPGPMMGGYEIELSDPEITVDAEGSGSITVGVAWCTSSCSDRASFTDAGRVLASSFTTAGPSASGTTLTWAETPIAEPVPGDTSEPPRVQFPQALIDALAPATPSLIGHFRQTGSGTDASKPPAPFTLTAQLPAAAAEPQIAVTPTSGLDPEGDSVTVTGTDFTGVGVYVRLCQQPEGEVGTPEGRPAREDCLEASTRWVSSGLGATDPMGEDGSFEVTLDVVAAFGSVDCTVDACGVFVSRDHLGLDDRSYDRFVPLSFGEEPTEPTTPTTEPTTPTTEPTTPTTEAPLEPGAIVDGELVWGIKGSFRQYLVGPIAHGTVSPLAPATQAPDNGPFTFPLSGQGTFASAAELDAAFAGGAHLYGHDGELDVTFSNPEVVIDGATGRLVADIEANEHGTDAQYDEEDVVVATLDLSGVTPTRVGDTVTYADIPATLTEDGEIGFSGYYAAGDALDPVTLVLTVEGADLGGIGAPDPNADKVTCTPTGPVPAGSEIRVCGSGFLPGEQVLVFLHSTPVQLAVITADAGGAVDAQVTIPATAEAGQHRIELRGVTSGRSIFSDPFTVTAAQAGPGALPRTGDDSGTLVPFGLGLVALGALAAAVAERRRLAAAHAER